MSVPSLVRGLADTLRAGDDLCSQCGCRDPIRPGCTMLSASLLVALKQQGMGRRRMRGAGHGHRLGRGLAFYPCTQPLPHVGHVGFQACLLLFPVSPNRVVPCHASLRVADGLELSARTQCDAHLAERVERISVLRQPQELVALLQLIQHALHVRHVLPGAAQLDAKKGRAHFRLELLERRERAREVQDEERTGQHPGGRGDESENHPAGHGHLPALDLEHATPE
eukprot:scaffold12352_cov129-Isochrysis_galbana.AAC.9